MRNCNWVRLLRKAQHRNDVNLLAEHLSDTGDIIYRVTAPIPAGGELLVHFDCDEDLTEDRSLVRMTPLLSVAVTLSSAAVAMASSDKAHKSQESSMTSEQGRAWLQRMTSPSSHLLSTVRELVSVKRNLSSPTDVSTWRRVSIVFFNNGE